MISTLSMIEATKALAPFKSKIESTDPAELVKAVKDACPDLTDADINEIIENFCKQLNSNKYDEMLKQRNAMYDTIKE